MLRTVIANRKNVYTRFVSFFFVGLATLAGELLLTGILLYFFSLPTLTAIGTGFFISLAISYFIFRKYTFRGTTRGISSGFIYFSIIAASGLLISIFGSNFLITQFELAPLLARFLMAAPTGLCNFLINLVYNFKVAHIPH